MRFIRGFLGGYIAPILGIWSLSQLFDFTIGDAGTLIAQQSHILYTTKPFYLLLGLASFYFFYVKFRHRYTPLTVIDTEISLHLESPSGDVATIDRAQRMRANHYDVTGYHRRITVDKGEIPQDSIRCHIDHCSHESQRCEFKGRADQRSWDFCHRFEEIPRSWFKLGMNTVTRTETYTARDAYTDDEEYHELSIPANYKHKRIQFAVFFHPERLPPPTSCQALRIHNNGVVNLNFVVIPPTGDRRPGIRIDIKNPIPTETYRFVWQYPPAAG